MIAIFIRRISWCVCEHDVYVGLLVMYYNTCHHLERRRHTNLCKSSHDESADWFFPPICVASINVKHFPCIYIRNKTLVLPAHILTQCYESYYMIPMNFKRSSVSRIFLLTKIQRASYEARTFWFRLNYLASKTFNFYSY